jgi:hypothetical protein
VPIRVPHASVRGDLVAEIDLASFDGLIGHLANEELL